jgi:hypothetical protein
VHARKRGVESFEKREKDVKRGKNKEKICVWKSKKEKRKNNKKNMCMIGMNQVKEKNKVHGKDVTLLRDETFTFFPTMCNPTTRTSSVPRSNIFFCPCTCPPF